MKTPKKIGILGGMGPAASAKLLDYILAIARNEYQAVQDTDFPPIILYSLPLTGFNESGVVEGPMVKRQLVAGLQVLEKAGAEVALVACNSVHIYEKEMQDAIRIPFLSIVNETVIAVKKSDLGKVGVLSSVSTRDAQLYQRALGNQNIMVLIPTVDEQKVVTEVILRVMQGVQGEKETQALQRIIGTLITQGAEGIVLGCTELPLAITQESCPCKLFDVMDVVSRKALQFAYNVNTA